MQPGKVIGNKLDLARKLAQLMPEKDEAAYLAMLRSGQQLLSIFAAAPRPSWSRRSTRWASQGMALEHEPDRLYPQTSLAAHVVGYTDVDGKGNAGHRARVRRAAVAIRRAAASRSSCRSPAASSRRSSMS